MPRIRPLCRCSVTHPSYGDRRLNKGTRGSVVEKVRAVEVERDSSGSFDSAPFGSPAARSRGSAQDDGLWEGRLDPTPAPPCSHPSPASSAGCPGRPGGPRLLPQTPCPWMGPSAGCPALPPTWRCDPPPCACIRPDALRSEEHTSE